MRALARGQRGYSLIEILLVVVLRLVLPLVVVPAVLVLPAAVIQLGLGDYIAGVHIMGWAIIAALPLTIGLALALWNPTMQKRAMAQVAWPEIMLITGVSTYVAVLEHMGTIDFVGDSVAGMASPLLVALVVTGLVVAVSATALALRLIWQLL